MKSVEQVLGAKGRAVWSVPPDATVYQALKLMAEKEVGALLVLDSGRLAGVISERDYARKVILHGKSSLETRVQDIMTAEVVCVAPAQSVEECMALMTAHRVRHLPVLTDGALLGVVSIGDVVKACLDEKDFLIHQLESYITGSPAT